MENLTDNFEEQNKPINSFLVEKLKPITCYVGEQNNIGNFFCQINDFCITGKQALEFINIADKFHYDVTFTKVDKLTIYFWKRYN